VLIFSALAAASSTAYALSVSSTAPPEQALSAKIKAAIERTILFFIAILPPIGFVYVCLN
jgi:hypothetical protein